MNTKKEATAAIRVLRPFIGDSQMRCLGDACRGEEKQFFFDKLCELAALVQAMPKTYQQDGKGDQAIAHLHYFTGGCDWWITEKDKGDESEGGTAAQHQAFGLAAMGDYPELGNISIVELLANGAELDLYWTPNTIGEIKEPGNPPGLDPAPAAAAKLGHAALVEAADNATAKNITALNQPPQPHLPSWHRLSKCL